MTWATILSTLGDTHGIPSRVVEQILSNNISSFSQLNLHQYRNGITSNRQCDGWNEARSVNNLGMAELLRTEPLGHSSKFYSGYKECNMRLPESGEASDWTANWNGDYASLAGGRKQNDVLTITLGLSLNDDGNMIEVVPCHTQGRELV
ncbi:hypothetical protein SASPL_150443 [Salvia splendens]|uniref:Uncharacterized protein n=1 Tax=Salvia splendens TaxID=180675 RepID=A0A8X8Z211_SALSN|nr:hypothetical protein SASPL_150443 [Salvia splendens]